jgi:hypothetical protein
MKRGKGTDLVPAEPSPPSVFDLDYWDEQARQQQHQQMVPLPEPSPPAPPLEPEPPPEPKPRAGLGTRHIIEFLLEEPLGDEIPLGDDLVNVDDVIDPDDEIEAPGSICVQFQWPFTETIMCQAPNLNRPWTRKDLLRFILEEASRLEAEALNATAEERLDRHELLCLLGGCQLTCAVRLTERFWHVIWEEY